jgi:hypothetical protein
MLSGARPIRRPSSLALRIPAFTRSVISERSSSAIAPTITTNRPAQWASRVDIFAQADELDAEMSQLVEHFQEVANASRYPVERGYEHDVETMSPGICQQLIEAGSFHSGTGNNVCVFVRNFVSALLGHFAEVEQLCFKVLVSGAHACVNRGALRFGFCAKCCG